MASRGEYSRGVRCLRTDEQESGTLTGIQEYERCQIRDVISEDRGRHSGGGRGSQRGLAASARRPLRERSGQRTEHQLPLPYAYDALEPVISADHDVAPWQASRRVCERVECRGSGVAEARRGDYAMVQHWSRQAAFNGGGHYSLMSGRSRRPGQWGGGEPATAARGQDRRGFRQLRQFKPTSPRPPRASKARMGCSITVPRTDVC